MVPMCLNASGIRDTSRVLRVSATTVMKLIGERAKTLPSVKLPERIADVEIDEMWSFVAQEKESMLVVAGLFTETSANAGFFSWKKNR